MSLFRLSMSQFLLFGEQALLVSALNDVSEDEHGDNKIEGRFGHLMDLVAEELEMSKVSPLGKEHDAYD